MENRSKFYTGGKWSNDTLQERFDNIKAVLDIFQKKPNAKPSIDKYDLEFAIKNAFVSKIYLSKAVETAYHNLNRKAIFGNLCNLYDTLVKKKELCLIHGMYNNQNVFFDICKLGDKISSFNRKLKKAGKKTLPPIIIEHVIPYNDIKFDIMNIKTISDFQSIFGAVSICLVTVAENTKLNNNGLKQKMPAGVNYTTRPFARYEQARIEIYGWKIVNGNIVPLP